MIKQHMPAPGPDSLVMVCGPPPMVNVVSGDKAPDKSQGPLAGMLKSLGYEEAGVYKF
jgi:cytochrome-b5 reductase